MIFVFFSCFKYKLTCAQMYIEVSVTQYTSEFPFKYQLKSMPPYNGWIKLFYLI